MGNAHVTQLTTKSAYDTAINTAGLSCILIYSSDDKNSMAVYKELVKIAKDPSFLIVRFYAINLINDDVKKNLMTETGITNNKSIVRFYISGARFKSLIIDPESVGHSASDIKKKLKYIIAHTIA
jgi:hypothetical protein